MRGSKNCMQATSQICVVGLATMGQNLALNIARNGFPVTVWNRSWDKTEATMARAGKGQKMVGARTPQEVAASLVRPRRLLLLVKAGQPVDDTIATFLPVLEKGDLIIANLSPKGYQEISRARLLEPTSGAFGRDVLVAPHAAQPCPDHPRAHGASIFLVRPRAHLHRLRRP